MNRQLYEYHEVFGYRFIPSLKTRVDHEGGGYLLRANSAGFRCNHEFVPDKPEGTFRMLLFGDSYTAGDGVSNKHRYGDRLEQYVPGLQVFNFGLSGSGTDQQYLIHREWARDIDHDLVVIGVLVENIRRVAARYRMYESRAGENMVLAKPYFVRGTEGGLTLHNVPVPREPIAEETLGDENDTVDRGGRFRWLRGAINNMGPGVKELAQRVSRYQPLPAYDSPEHPDWLLMRDILLRWIEECDKPVLICPIPLYHYVEETASSEGYRARFAELEQMSSARVFDPLDDLRVPSMAVRRSYRFEQDVHPTPAGHDALAQSLAPAIRGVMKGEP